MQTNIGDLTEREKWLLAIMIGQRFDSKNLSYIFLKLSMDNVNSLKTYLNTEKPDLIWNLSTEEAIGDPDFDMLNNPVVKRVMRRKGAVEKLYKQWQLTGVNRYRLPFDKVWE